MSYEEASGAPPFDLVARAQGGDAIALTVVLSRVRDALCRLVARRIPANLSTLISPEDVVQETLVEVFRHIGTFENRGTDAFARWTATLALRQLLRQIRHFRAAKRSGGGVQVQCDSRADSAFVLLDALAGKGDTPSRCLSRRETAALLQVALASLPLANRQALQLVYVEGCSAAQAGERIGRSERGVYGLCRRGLEKLRSRMDSASLYLAHVR